MTAPAAAGRWPGALAALLLFGWYLATAAPGLMWFDSGEFALVAAQGGVSHPPGQPLYTLLSRAAWALGGLAALNGLSALTAALCALPADALLRRLTTADAPRRLLALLAIGGLAPVWDQATRIELYAPAALLFGVIVAGGVATVDDRRCTRRWLWLGVGVGALACLNAVFAIGAALTVGAYAAIALRRAPLTLAKAAGAAALGGVLGLAPYLQVLWGADDPRLFVWGDFDTAGGWWAFLTGRDYGHTAHAAWGLVPSHAADWALWLAGQGAVATVALGWLGWAAEGQTRRRAGLLALPVLVGVAFTFTYGRYHPPVPDYNGYFMPALWLGAVGLAALASRARPAVGVAMLGLLVVAGTVTGERPLTERTRHGVHLPLTLAKAWLDATPPDGVLLVESDHLVFPLMFRQEALGERPDVLLINVGFASSGWYWRHLYARHPDLPQIPLAAPSTAARLARLLAKIPHRPVRVEHMGLAGGLRRRPCLDTFGLRLAPCDPAADDPQRFLAVQQQGWQSAGHDLITPNVLAALAFQRAEAAWALGDGSGALAALSAGAPPSTPPREVPPGLPRPPQTLPLVRPAADTLIGDPVHAIRLGRALLGTHGLSAAADTWQVP